MVVGSDCCWGCGHCHHHHLLREDRFHQGTNHWVCCECDHEGEDCCCHRGEPGDRRHQGGDHHHHHRKKRELPREGVHCCDQAVGQVEEDQSCFAWVEQTISGVIQGLWNVTETNQRSKLPFAHEDVEERSNRMVGWWGGPDG